MTQEREKEDNSASGTGTSGDIATDGESEGVPKTLKHCSFCGKAQAEVMALICGPGGIMICDECVILCSEVLTEQYGIRFTEPLFRDVGKTQRKMKASPEDVLDTLNRLAKEIVAIVKKRKDESGKDGVSSDLSARGRAVHTNDDGNGGETAVP